MSYRLGVDVGGTFTDLLLVNEATGQTWKAKVSSTPHDQSDGVLRGLDRVCGLAGISPEQIDHVMHGTTVATNTVLTGTGARVGLVTTKGYRQVLQIARSFVPGGLGGWVIYNKSLPMAPLVCTIEADERVGAKGEVVHKLDEAALRTDAACSSASASIEALTVSLINAFANDAHERRIKEIAQEVLPGMPVSLSSRGRARDAGVRAHGHDGRQFVRAAARAEVRAQPAVAARATRAQRQAAHPAFRRRPRLGEIGRGVPGQPADVRPRRRRDRRALGGGRRPGFRTC